MIRLKRLYAHDFKQLQEIEIHFPDAGRILVQGKNEAGKSTLFEAVYFALFGLALNTESSARSLDDLIGYDKEKARVELDVLVRDRVFKITRTLIRAKSNKWELEIVRPDGAVEQVRGNKPVNDRLISELGFDAEALLNTCFVEQKKLEKLEGMSKAKREESLSKLLNLERLLELEEHLKLRGEDEKMLTRLTHRVELARAQSELPGVTAELQRTEHQLKLLDLRLNLERAIQETQARADAERDIAAQSETREQLRQKAARVDALDKAQQMLGAVLIRYDALAQDTEQYNALLQERAEIERAVQEQLPALQTRQDEIKRLGVLAARLTRIEAARGSILSDLQRAQNVQQELDAQLERGSALNAQIAQHETRANELEQKLKNYDIGDALGEWIAAAQIANTDAADETRLLAKRQERDAIGRAQRQYLIYLGAIVVGIGLVSAILLPALVLSARNLFLGVIAALVLTTFATIAVVLIAGRLINLNRQSARVTEDLGKIEGEANAKRTLALDAQTRVNTAAEKLQTLGVSAPADAGAAQAKRVELAATLENKTRAELADERDAEREKLNYARAQRDEVTRRIQELSPANDTVNILLLERRRDKAEAILNRWRPRLARRAAPLNVPPETEALRDAYRTTQGDIRNLQQRAQQADKLTSDAARIQQRMAKTQNELQEQYTAVTPLLEGDAPAWSATLQRAAYVALQAKLLTSFNRAGGNQVRAQMAQAEKQFGALEREHAIRSKNARDAIQAAQRLERELGITAGFSAEPTAEELQTRVAQLAAEKLPERAALDTTLRRLHQRVGELQGARDRFARELGLGNEIVNLDEARLELQTEQRAQLQRKYGAEIVARARRRIVQKILPATMEYMRRILPQLTRDRYHDADLDPESYKIKVWDERAGQSGAWKEKNIFSGGTKDQFSLALRLAFALATLPQERGASPGFIFLDEPLGSFDDERANALLFLLTEGEIGRAFDQILLISHVPVQESKFTHRLRLENGRVIENSMQEKTGG